MNSSFLNYSAYYDMLYADKDYLAEASYISRTLKGLNSSITEILEYGCGTGNHAAYLCNKGFFVTGIEKSEEMVSLALKKSIRNFKPQIGDITNFDLNKKFDAVTALFHVISYLTENQSLYSCFNTTNKHLRMGGVFMFDIWYAPAVLHQEVEARIKRLENNDTEIIRFAEPKWVTESNVVEVHYEIFATDKRTSTTQKFKELHPMRYFSKPEIEMLAQQSGFKLVKSEEFLTCKEPSRDTWGVCFILEKVHDA